MIYFITDGENVKIGRTNDLESRISTLQVGNSRPLRILYIINDVEDSFESHVHGICVSYHISGEWFKLGAIDHLQKNPWFRENMIKAR